MNTANLQLEGLYLALVAINDTLVEKGVLTQDEIGGALRHAERTALEDDRNEDLSPAERDAIAFGPRLLAMAAEREAGSALPSFSDLARFVGLHKTP